MLLVPLSFMLRTNPEDVGLLPDGDRDHAPGAPSEGGRPRPSRVSEVSLTGRQALRSPAFWFIILAFALGGLGLQGFQSNWIPYLEGKGFAAGTAAVAITVYGIFSVSARMLWGLLADRFQVRYLIVIQSLLTASSVLLLLYVIGPVMLFTFVVCFGLTMGGSFLLRPLIVANYFGRMHIGAITGYMRPFQATTDGHWPRRGGPCLRCPGFLFLELRGRHDRLRLHCGCDHAGQATPRAVAARDRAPAAS